MKGHARDLGEDGIVRLTAFAGDVQAVDGLMSELEGRHGIVTSVRSLEGRPLFFSVYAQVYVPLRVQRRRLRRECEEHVSGTVRAWFEATGIPSDEPLFRRALLAPAPDRDLDAHLVLHIPSSGPDYATLRSRRRDHVNSLLIGVLNASPAQRRALAPRLASMGIDRVSWSHDPSRDARCSIESRITGDPLVRWIQSACSDALGKWIDHERAMPDALADVLIVLDGDDTLPGTLPEGTCAADAPAP